MKKIFLIIIILFCSIWSFAQNQNISNGNIFDGEPSIAINPLNSQHMIVAWMGYFQFTKIYIKTKVTFDGGHTWSSLNSIPHTNAMYGSADPSLAFDNSGNVFLSFIDFNKNSDSGAVFVVKSSDGGLTWGNPVEVINANSDTQKPIDRPWISIDTSGGINDGNIYINSMPPNVFGYLPPPYHPYFISSTDGCNSFNQWKYLDTTNWLAGNLIRSPMATNCVSSNGTFYAIYPSYVYSQNPLAQFIVASSSDAGHSFSYHTVFSSTTNVSDTLAKKGYLILSDPTNSDHLVFAYLDIPYGDIDVFICESFDAGVSWGNPIRVNDDSISNNRMQDLLWGDFDNDGDIVFTWRDRRNGTDSTYETAYEIWGAYKNKDSVNFSSNFRISDTLIAYDTILAYSGNDFMCVKLTNDTLNAVWGDTRNGKLNIWFQRMQVNNNITSIYQKHNEEINVVNIYPNPTSSMFTIEGKDIKNILIYNALGEVVGEYGKTNLIDLSHFANGNYFIKIKTKNGIVSKKIFKME
jgi:hypothetical protein